MVVATINWALLLITKSISLLDLCKYANAMLIHTSNYVPFNMWQSGTLSLWLTGKSVGSVKNLSNDSDLKWLRRETVMNEDHVARLRLLSSTRLQVFVSLSFESMQPLLPVCFPRTRKAYANWIVPPGVFGNGVLYAVFAVSEPAQSQDFWNPEKATYSQLHLIFSSFVSCKQPQSLYFFIVRIYKILHLPGDDGFLCTYQMSDYHFFQWINSILETFTAP